LFNRHHRLRHHLLRQQDRNVQITQNSPTNAANKRIKTELKCTKSQF